MNINKQFVEDVRKLMQSVGTYLLSAQNTVKTEWKSRNNPVTQADRDAQEMLQKGLNSIVPQASFRGEESAWSLWDGLCWVVDPLDGTRAYINNKEGWTVIVALFDNDKVIFGAIYSPLDDVFYHATSTSKAYRNDEVMCVNESKKDIVLSSRLKELQLPMQVVLHHGAGYKAMLVAQGDAGAYLHLSVHNKGLQVWDVAAASLIVQQAKGVVSCLDGSQINLHTDNPLVDNMLFANKSITPSIYDIDFSSKRKEFEQALE